MSDEQNSEPIDDEAMRRLRAADPAAEVAVDADAIRMSVDEKLWTGIGEQVDEVAVQREVRRRRSGGVWVGVAAAACAVALAAGLGFRAGSATTPTVTAAAPAISLNQSGQQNAVGEAAATPALGAPTVAGAALDAKMMPSYVGGRVLYSAAPSLSDQAGTSPGYAYDATAVDGKAATTALAKAMGITAAPVETDGTWTAGVTDGTGANVTVMIDGLRSFYGYDPSVDPNACVKPEPAPAIESASPDGSASDGSVSSGGSVGAAPATPCTPKGGQAPSADDAIAASKDLMKAAGVDPARYQWQADATSTPGYAYVTAFEVVDGRQTGAAWGFGVVAKGRMVSVNGTLAPVVALGDYPVISPRAAVDRLNDSRFSGFFGGVMPMAAARGGVAMDATVSSDVVAAPTTPPAPMTPGSPFAWPISEVTITACELGVAQNYTNDGATVLIPTYLCTGADGGQYSVVAVADSALNTAALTAK